ncbi:MAG: DUF975 family protein [Clostridium sp.]|jgi:uncharacterized membrane protein|nr:DUF975 family protein [Clostridium sp.]
MTRYQSNAQLKTLAKDRLTNHYRTAVTVFFLAWLIQFVSSETAERLVPSTTVPGTALFLCLSFAVSVAAGVLDAGISCFFLHLACGRPCSLTALFYGFREQADKALSLSFVSGSLRLVCFTPWRLVFRQYLLSRAPGFLWLTLACLAAGLFVYVPFSLMFSQSFYLMLDFPGCGAVQILKMSARIMKGHKKRLLCLEAGFLPLMLLGFLSLGFGFLWLLPYRQMARTFFFLDVMAPDRPDSHV